jgi:D-alanine-D-alanine ligase
MKRLHEPVLILHHAVSALDRGPSAESDAGVMDEVRAVDAALTELGIPHRVAAIGSLSELPALLTRSPEKIVFNLVENLPPRPIDAALVPSICEAFGKGCTGNDAACQTLSLDKWRTKSILNSAGLPVPAGILVQPGAKASRQSLPQGPFIVKPLLSDASEGIHADSVVAGAGPDLDRIVRRVHRDFKHPALIEQFFGTRELNVSVLRRGGKTEVLPLAEIEFRGYGRKRPPIVDYAAKWHPDSYEYQNTVRVIPARLAPKLAREITQCALAAWETLGCSDYARVDLRLTDDGRFAILEINPNPDISPGSGFEAALKAAKIPFSEFVRAMCANASKRQQALTPGKAGSARTAPRPRSATRPVIRYTEPSDRDPILAFLRATGFFHDGEIDIAREVLDEALKNGPAGHYQSFTLLAQGKPVGWVCIGPTPCTIGTFDVYWIGVSSVHQGKGYGRALLDHAEKVIRERSGSMIVIETSGRTLYDSTRGFYLAAGYHETARIPDFYGPGDPRVIYVKSLVFP